MRGEVVPEVPVSEAPAAVDANWTTEAIHSAITHEEVTFCYCTEFLIRGSDIPVDIVQARMGELGDSLLVVGDSDVVKVHVHTDHPGRALEIGLEYGELLDIAIDNMQEQNRVAAEQAAQRRGEAHPAPVENGQAAHTAGSSAEAPAIWRGRQRRCSACKAASSRCARPGLGGAAPIFGRGSHRQRRSDDEPECG